MKYLNKSDVINNMTKKSGLSTTESRNALKAIISTITKILSKNQGLRLMGFGNFKNSHYKARRGHNPQTGKSMRIPAHRVPAFKASRVLRNTINK